MSQTEWQGSRPDAAIEPKGQVGPLEVEIWYAGVRERLRLAGGERSYREIAGRTCTHPETVRRYFDDGKPCARFLANFSEAYGVTLDWLLLGLPAVRLGPRASRSGTLTITTVVNLESGAATMSQRLDSAGGR